MLSGFFCFLLLLLESQSVMESRPQQQQNLHHHQPPPQNQLPNDDGSGGKSSYLCRQSSSRWTPTTEQIRILKDLYYNNGVRSPSADQIQKIAAKLRQYGKIEGKNVFYWFQNHKARERQKKRLTSDIPMQRSALWRPEDNSAFTTKYPNFTTGAPSSSTCVPGLNAAANYAYGSLAMEKSFRDCSISSGGYAPVAANNNFSWAGATADPYTSPYPFFPAAGKNAGMFEAQEEQEGEEVHAAAEIETLRLFPMHGEDISAGFNIKPEPNCYYPNWYSYSNNGNRACSRASLELSLNSSYGGARSKNSP